jgi:hypothetical protein
MFRIAMIIGLLLATCAMASAAEPKARGFYLAAAAGQSIYDEDGAFGSFGDDEDKVFHAAAGYKILRYLAVEARYVDLGSFSIGFDDIDITATSIHVVGIIPFGKSGWELFGQLGVGNINVDILGLTDIDESAAAGGIGVRFSPTPRFGIGVQTDVYVWEEAATYNMSVGGTQLSFQFIF